MAGEPSSLTDAYGALLTTTLRAYADSGRLKDNISRGNKFLSWLREKGQFRTQDGGERVQVNLMYGLNSTADIYSGYGVLDTTPQDGITAAFYDWAQLSTSVAISRKEERQNSGKARVISLLQSKITQAEASLTELLNNCLVNGRITTTTAQSQFLRRIGRMDSGALGPYPIPAIVDVNVSRSVAIGNINGSTYSWWRNQYAASSASTHIGYKNELGNLYNTCSKGPGGPPDFFLSDQIAWEQYFNGLQSQERFIINDPRTVNVLGGSDAIKFRNAAWIWDEVVPDPQATAEVVDAQGTMAESVVYMLNTNTWEFITDSETDFITTPFVRPENQDARVAQILWMGAVGVNNRRKNGVLASISWTAFT